MAFLNVISITVSLVKNCPMSRSTTQHLTCPCGEEYTYSAYEYVNVAEDPRLRYIVLAGLLNVAICPICGRRAELPLPFIYSDPAYELLAYVHPQADAPEEARLLILERLRSVYKDIKTTAQMQEQNKENGNSGGRAISVTPTQAQIMPPLKVLFGLEELVDVLNAKLEPEDRMGKLAMNTQSRDAAERGQFLDITRKLATEMDCCIEVEDLPDEYTVWLYGSRKGISALMRVLTPQG